MLVVGSLNIDLVVGVEHWPRPGETLMGTSLAWHPGGKGANQAAAAAAAGAATAMVGRVGADQFGETLISAMGSFGVDVSQISRDQQAPTGTAIIGVEPGGENRIVVLAGANANVSTSDLDSVNWSQFSVVLLQLEIPVHVVMEAARRAHAAGCTVLLDPAPAVPLPSEIWNAIDIVTPNEHEAQALGALAIRSPEQGIVQADALRRRYQVSVIIKLGGRGCVAALDQGQWHFEAIKVEAKDATAAGDIFSGALAARLVSGYGMHDAITWANACAALSTTRRGAMSSVPTAAEVDRFVSRMSKAVTL